MDTFNIIMVSVLSTLGIVAVVTAVVVIFNKLSKKYVVDTVHGIVDAIKLSRTKKN